MTPQEIPARKYAVLAFALPLLLLSLSALSRAQRDPAEPPEAKPAPKLLLRPRVPISRREVDEAGMRTLIEQLVACKTRN